MLKMLLST